MEQKNIIVPKTARYFTLGAPSGKTETVWFVCHGYGQLAAGFLQNFDVLDTEKNLVIAPEGLHRFYWKGFSDKVVASWMTKEDREHDIADYIHFLDAVYREVMKGFEGRNVKVNVLGFSQGTATVCRWIAAGRSAAHSLFLWAGAFPPDMDLKLSRAVFGRMKVTMIAGDQDEFLNEQEIKKQQELLSMYQPEYELVRFAGKHRIDKETLLRLA